MFLDYKKTYSSYTELAKHLNTIPNSPHFQKFAKYLRIKNILKITKYNGKNIEFTIDNKLLFKNICESEYYKLTSAVILERNDFAVIPLK